MSTTPGNPPTPPQPLPVVKKGLVQVKGRIHHNVRLFKAPSAFLPEKASSSYYEYIRPQTQGKVTPLINGRNSGAAGFPVDLSEPLNEMETVVRSLGKGDFVYLAAWFFDPDTPLTLGLQGGASTWGELFALKAEEDVKVRILINDFDSISRLDQWLQVVCLDPLKILVETLPAKDRDNFKYTVSLHPAHFGELISSLAGLGSKKTHIASHHQKFLVARKGDTLTAFCGGVDIESRKAPINWSDNGLIGWHDIHFKLEGPIAYDLEGEFVMRWNQEKDKSQKTPPISGWKPHETLSATSISSSDNVAEKKIHEVQMLRTVSSDVDAGPFENKRDDILKIYKNIIHMAKHYLYLENQYFRDQSLADKLAARGKANPNLKLILVVVGSAEDDDGDNVITKHGNYLQHLFFKKVTDAFGSRSRVYTMFGRAVHSKLMIVDDEFIVGGSANANSRSFKLDSELNISLHDKKLATEFRQRLWAHNLGIPISLVSDFVNMFVIFDRSASINATANPQQMVGEGIVKYDFTKTKGVKGAIPDEIAYMDFDDLEDSRGEGLVVV